MSVWINFKNNFNNIISNFHEYDLILKSYSKYEYNLLFYSCIGFPIDLLIDEFLKVKFNNNINKKELIWNKNIIYYENQNFFEIDLNNPNISNDYSFLTEMLLFIIKNNFYFIYCK